MDFSAPRIFLAAQNEVATPRLGIAGLGCSLVEKRGRSHIFYVHCFVQELGRRLPWLCCILPSLPYQPSTSMRSSTRSDASSILHFLSRSSSIVSSRYERPSHRRTSSVIEKNFNLYLSTKISFHFYKACPSDFFVVLGLSCSLIFSLEFILGIFFIQCHMNIVSTQISLIVFAFLVLVQIIIYT